MVLCGAIAALAVIIVGIILLAKGCSGGTDALAGTWEFDGTTTYSFDGSGSGAMELPSISYDFTYTIDGNKLMINYANESVRDSEIHFSSPSMRSARFAATRRRQLRFRLPEHRLSRASRLVRILRRPVTTAI